MAHLRVLPGRKRVTIMNRTLFKTSLAAVLLAGAAYAQNSAPVAQPSTPAPAVNPDNSGSAPTVVQAPNAAPNTGSPTQIVYTPKLPTAAELTNAAAAQGYTVERIVTTANQVVAFYRTSNGQATTVAYQALPPSGTTTTAAPVTAAPAPAVVVTAPPPTVVYETAPRVVYYDYPYYYGPVWYPSVSVGFGFRSYHGGYFRGGFRHR